VRPRPRLTGEAEAEAEAEAERLNRPRSSPDGPRHAHAASHGAWLDKAPDGRPAWHGSRHPLRPAKALLRWPC
jgi:hypothetical protein